MDKPVIGSGKLLLDKKGKLLVQGDDKVISSNPNESHKLITRKNPDGSSRLYMVPSEGVNKGKFFLVMPENNIDKPDISNDVLSSNNVSMPLPENSTFPNSSEPIWGASGTPYLSTVLKNIANHISSESKATEDVDILKSNAITTSNQVPTEVESPSSISPFVPTGASMIDNPAGSCESQVNQECDVKSNKKSSEPKPYVTEGSSCIPGNSSTVPPVSTIPIAPLSSVPSLPSSQPMMILTSAAVPAEPLRTFDQPLLAALNAPLHPLPAGTSPSQPMTTYMQTPYVVVSSTLTSNQTTLSTTSNIQQMQNAGVPNPSLQIPLIPVLIKTNQTFTSVPSFLQTPLTNVPIVPKPVPLIPNVIKQTTTASSCTFHQVQSTAPAVPVMTSSEKTNITNVTHIQQAPEVALVSPPATESPLFVTAQEAAALLGNSPVPNNKTLQDTLARFIKNRKMAPQPTCAFSSKNLKCRKNSVTPIACKSTVLSNTSHSINLTTTASLTRSLLKATSEATSAHVQAVPFSKTADENPVLISNQTKECSSDKTVACSTSTTATFKTATNSGGFADTSPQVSGISDGTISSSATPMLLFSHNAARNLKPTGLLDPQQGSKTVHNTTTPKILPKVTIPQAKVNKPLNSLSGFHHSLPSVLKLDKNMFQFVIHESSTTKPKTVTVFKVPVSNEQTLESTSSGCSSIPSSTVTPLSVSASSPMPTAKATIKVITTSSNKITPKNVPVHVIVAQTSSPTKTSYISSNSNASVSSKPVFTYARSTGQLQSSPCVVTPVQDETDSSERRKPQIIISTLSSSKLKNENATMGNLVSIVPSKCAKLTTPSIGSLRNISPKTESRVVNVKTINDDKNVRNILKPAPKLPPDNRKHVGSTQLNITSCPKISEQVKTSCKPLIDKSADDLPILIDSVFSLSTEDHTTKSATPNIDFFEADDLYRDSDASDIQSLNPQQRPTNSGQSTSQIFRELDHLSNFNGVILPDEAITESKLFSPSYVVLEALRMHGDKMEGVNTRCSRTCRQKFLSKKSNIRLAIHRKKPLSKRVEFQKASVADKSQGHKGTLCATSDYKVTDASISSNGVNIKRSSETLRAKLDAAGHVTASTKDDTITKIDENRGKQVTSNNVLLRLKNDSSDGVKTTACSAVPIKKVPNTEQFYMIRVDGKTVLVPFINGGSQPKAFIINEEKINLASYAVSKSSPKDSTRPNKIVLPRVSPKACSAAPTTTNACSIVSTPAQPPTTTSAQVNIKPEPVTYGYGEEASIQPAVVVKQERMDRGYSDEPPKLERMDVEPSERTSCKLKLKREVPIPELTAEEVAIPAKVPKVLSKEERISSLKELLKKQEKDLEEIRQRRIAEATPVDLDF